MLVSFAPQEKEAEVRKLEYEVQLLSQREESRGSLRLAKLGATATSRPAAMVAASVALAKEGSQIRAPPVSRRGAGAGAGRVGASAAAADTQLVPRGREGSYAADTVVDRPLDAARDLGAREQVSLATKVADDQISALQERIRKRLRDMEAGAAAAVGGTLRDSRRAKQ